MVAFLYSQTLEMNSQVIFAMKFYLDWQIVMVLPSLPSSVAQYFNFSSNSLFPIFLLLEFQLLFYEVFQQLDPIQHYNILSSISSNHLKYHNILNHFLFICTFLLYYFLFIIHSLIQHNMYCLNHRIGILFRENLQKKSYQIRYFFIDDDANLFYIANLSRLQKVIRISKNFSEVKSKLQNIGEKSFNLHRYNISNVKNYHSEAILPFSNRTCIQLKEKDVKETKDDRGYQLFGLVDEDTPLLLEEINRMMGKKKEGQLKSEKKLSIIQEEKIKEQKMIQAFFQRFQLNEDRFRMKSSQQKGQKDLHYEGQFVQIQNGNNVAHGKGKQILISQGITYSGLFKYGKKHGEGYLVNSNLDTIYCDFIDDEIVGI